MATVVPSVGSDLAGPVISPVTQRKVLSALEHRVVLNNISWETYERLLEEIDNSGIRLAFDRGILEILSPISQSHERFKKLLGFLVEALTEELGIPRRSLSGTTWKRQDMKQGLEADECYYLTSEPLIRSKRIIDLTVDPPPDLAIEVENTVSAVDKLGIYATLKVPEVWRFDGETLKIFALRADATYEEKPTSVYFPAAASTKVAQWLEKCETMDETIWVKEFRRWVRENLTRVR